MHDVPGYKGLPPPTTTRTVRRPMSVGGVGMDPGPARVGSANRARARVKGSSLPYLIPLPDAIASATPPGRCGREAEETWVPSRFSLTAPLPVGVGCGLFRPPPAGSRAGGGLGLSRVRLGPPREARGRGSPPWGEESEVWLYASRLFALCFFVSRRFFPKFFHQFSAEFPTLAQPLENSTSPIDLAWY